MSKKTQQHQRHRIVFRFEEGTSGTFGVRLPTSEVVHCSNYKEAHKLQCKLEKLDNDAIVLSIGQHRERHAVRNCVTGKPQVIDRHIVQVYIVRWPERFIANPENGGCRFVSSTGFEIRSCEGPSLHADALYGKGYSYGVVTGAVAGERCFSNRRAANLFVHRLKTAVKEYNREHHSIPR